MKIVGLIALSILLNSCGPQTAHIAPIGGGSDPGDEQKQTGKVTPTAGQVVDLQGLPLAGARVLIGDAVDSPFVGNFLTTNNDGRFAAPAAWKSPLPVTIEAPGYVRTTFLAVQPGREAFVLNLQEGRESIELSGEATGFGQLKKDGFVDFGIILRLADRARLFHFNVSDLLSPEVDEFSVMGKNIAIPSNFALPKQSENYVIPVTLNKPKYRTILRSFATYDMVAGWGKFPFKQVVKDLQDGKTYYDVLNSFNWIGAGRASVLVGQKQTVQNLPVTGQTFAPTVMVQTGPSAPGFSQLISLWNREGSLYFPSDVKRMDGAGARQLNGPAQSEKTVLAIMGSPQVKKSNIVTFGEQMSRAIEKVSGGAVTPQYLPLVPAPTFNGDLIQAQAPPLAPPGGFAGTLFVISDVDVTDTDKSFYERKTPIWEIYGEGWVQQADLPEWPDAVGQSTIKRLEAIYMSGADFVNSGPPMVHSATHATKNAMDF